MISMNHLSIVALDDHGVLSLLRGVPVDALHRLVVGHQITGQPLHHTSDQTFITAALEMRATHCHKGDVGSKKSVRSS